MVREGFRKLAGALRQEPYEAAIGTASLSGVVEMATGRGSNALSVVIPHWALHVLGAMAMVGGALTLAGLVVAALAADDAGGVLARRMEQTGQIMLSGVLVALGIGATTYGISSLIPGAMQLAVGAAAAVRAAAIARILRTGARRP
jgi:hypothetical protein